jgi:uncharacterized CHY-type Zn-finger protein
MSRTIHGVEVFGQDVDHQTGCSHWHSDLDIIAIKFKCCSRWYPCFDCHTAIADHEPMVWPAREFDENAVLCGSCGSQLTIHEYLDCESTCPSCEAQFNPGCSNHYHLYFGVP